MAEIAEFPPGRMRVVRALHLPVIYLNTPGSSPEPNPLHIVSTKD